ncbi:MAG TPA: acyltransferase [Solirubrobacteraceae bacterium]|jgi:acetyltransferase-like isoleucine patch superfamily enzyme
MMLGAYNLWRELHARIFSTMVARSFLSCGEGTRLVPPIEVYGPKRIVIGERVHVGAGSWFHTADEHARLEIGDGTRMSGLCVLSAAERVRLGRAVLLGRNVYVADHTHGVGLAGVPVYEQELEKVMPVEIGDGAWLGQNVVILPGVTVGAGAVVGANSVVGSDVPPRTVVVGAPARVVRELPGSA